MIEGSECRCGYKTVSKKSVCPSCGKRMEPREFSDEGKVLSFVKLEIPPEHHDKPMNIVMVEIDDGPKMICWAANILAQNQRVKVFSEGGLIQCKVP